MALTADFEYQTMGESKILKMRAGAADVLYKGAIVNIGTDGYLKVAADVANEVPLGVVKKQVVSGGVLHEDVEVECHTIIKLPHAGAAQTDVGALFHASADDTLGDGAGVNVTVLGMCVDWETGYLWIDLDRRAL
jgi:hypothetical protein